MNKYYINCLIIFFIFFCLLSSNRVHANLPLQGKLIVIDAGHGGKDPGAINNNIYEKTINLQISKKLEKELSKNGASVILIRNCDRDLSNGVKKHRKRVDFDKRIKIINESKADMYISIHLNYLNDKNYYGPQVFYDKSNKELANVIQNNLNDSLSGGRKIKTIPKNTYMYKKLNIPGVLIECGFLSNDIERNLLISKSYQQKIVENIVKGLIDYYY